jgi:hypothetical protein
MSARFACCLIFFFALACPGFASEIASKNYIDSYAVLVSQKGVENGVAALDANGKIPYTQFPIGTAANTIAAGNDTRIVSAEQVGNRATEIGDSTTATTYPTTGAVRAALNAQIVQKSSETEAAAYSATHPNVLGYTAE